MIPEEAVEAYLSHNIGYDFSNFDRFSTAVVRPDRCDPGLTGQGRLQLGEELGPDGEMTRDEFFHHALGRDRLRRAVAARKNTSPTSWRRSLRRRAAAEGP